MNLTTIDLLGMAGATLTTICWVPQALRMMRSRDTRAISISGSSTFSIVIAFWLIYGIALNNWPLIISNGVTLALMLVIVGLKIRYG